MNVLTLRTGYEALESHRAVADRFIAALVVRDFVTASADMAKSVSWFGESIPKADWITRCTTAFASATLAAQGVGDVDSDELRALPATTIGETLDGPLQKTHRLHVYQLCRNDIWVTVGILTAGSDTVVVDRVLDLRRLKQLAAA